MLPCLTLDSLCMRVCTKEGYYLMGDNKREKQTYYTLVANTPSLHAILVNAHL
jgi:hypothetical protein